MVSHNLILKSLGPSLNSHLGEPQLLVLGGGPRVHGGEQEGVEGVHSLQILVGASSWPPDLSEVSRDMALSSGVLVYGGRECIQPGGGVSSGSRA